MTLRRPTPRPCRLINPMTGEVRLTTTREARRLLAYGWRHLSPADFFAYQSTVASYIARKAMGSVVRH